MASAPLNSGLFRLHCFFCLLYALFTLAIVFICLQKEEPLGILIGLFPLGFALLHFYAAKGAKYGRSSGRTLSRVIAVLWFFGFPIGTILGIYVFVKTGRTSWTGRET
ncbi:MAG TPA: hypothetical protein VGI93_06610 [Steroidobacteraceae bacterium]